LGLQLRWDCGGRVRDSCVVLRSCSMMRCKSFMCSAIRAATSGWSLQRRMGGAHGWCVAGWCASRCRSRTVAGRCRRAGPIRSRLIHRLSSVQLGLAWPSPAWTSGPDEEGRSLQCVPVREPRGLSRGLCHPAAAVASRWTGKGPATDGWIRGWPPTGLPCRVGHHGSSHRPAPTGHRAQRPWSAAECPRSWCSIPPWWGRTKNVHDRVWRSHKPAARWDACPHCGRVRRHPR
jgi:hypothetical protein